jgi:phytanoyl-CoA hydroxylase
MSSDPSVSPASPAPAPTLKVLTPDQLAHFHREGYVVVNDVLSAEVRAQLLAYYSSVLDDVAKELIAEGVLSQDYAALPLDQRLIAVSKESGRNFPQRFDCSLPQGGITKDTPLSVGPAVFRVLTDPRLLDVAQDILGSPEITSNPVQHMRFKLPMHAVAGGFSGMVSAVPFHQDNGVLLEEADNSHILTIWMPITPSTLTNGVMQVVPRSHCMALQQHCPTNEGLAIPPSKMAALQKADQEMKAISLPMPAGSALLMTHRTIHKSLDNTTDSDVRVSMDLRYQTTGTASGRPAFDSASFVARSERDPSSVLTDPAVWEQKWINLRSTLAEAEEKVRQGIGKAERFNRWDPNAVGCA